MHSARRPLEASCARALPLLRLGRNLPRVACLAIQPTMAGEAADLATCISGLVVEYIVAIDVTRVRFSADALCNRGSGTGSRWRHPGSEPGLGRPPNAPDVGRLKKRSNSCCFARVAPAPKSCAEPALARAPGASQGPAACAQASTSKRARASKQVCKRARRQAGSRRVARMADARRRPMTSAGCVSDVGVLSSERLAADGACAPRSFAACFFEQSHGHAGGNPNTPS